MAETGAFEIGRVVADVPTDFVVLDGQRQVRLDHFLEMMKTVKGLAKGAVDADRLGWQWDYKEIDAWVARGVMERFEITQTDGWGGELTWKKIGPGPHYAEFMAALDKLEDGLQAERIAAAREQRRERLQAELDSLSDPVADLMRDLDDETEANRESAVDAVDGAGMDPWEKEAAQESARDAVEVL